MNHRAFFRAVARPAASFLLAAGLLAADGAQAQDAASSVPGVTVGKGWIHTTSGPGADAAAYFTIRNTGTADTLVSATCPIARKTELVGADGKPVAAIAIGAGATLTLAPGGTHILLERNRFRLFPKATLPCSVNFRDAGSMMLYLHVEPENASSYQKSRGTPVDH